MYFQTPFLAKLMYYNHIYTGPQRYTTE